MRTKYKVLIAIVCIVALCILCFCFPCEAYQVVKCFLNSWEQIISIVTLLFVGLSYVFQKKSFRRERFESVFFKLLEQQKNIVTNLKAEFYFLSEGGDLLRYNAVSQDLFVHAKFALWKIFASIDFEQHKEQYSKQLVDDMNNYLYYMGSKPDEYSDFRYDKEEKRVSSELEISLTNKLYGIDIKRWKAIKGAAIINQVKHVFYLFFWRYQTSIGHYFRNLHQLLQYIYSYEEVFGETKCKEYAQYVQSSMTTGELTLLYYHLVLKEDMRELFIRYDFFKDLRERHLIKAGHNGLIGVELERRK